MHTPSWRSTELQDELRDQAALLEGLDPETDARSLMRHDMAVHRLIYKAAADRHLEEVLIRHDNLATRIWCLLLDKLPSVASHFKETQYFSRQSPGAPDKGNHEVPLVWLV